MMKPLRRLLITTLLATLCTACGSRDSDSQSDSTNISGVNTAEVAGFWDFSNQDPNFPDEQYVELTTNGVWNIYAQFPNDPDTQNCYDHQVATFKPIGNDMYEATSGTGLILNIGLVIVNNELVYTLVRPDDGSVSTFAFTAVQGFLPEDLPVCG